ncbi:photosynthetic complex assembly protein PuhC [Roseisalinus antarcticus]|uniref:Photosynthetic complex assembly protein n=1 Tax=Roseisalinus antarcticus TaxID=254357 RepID=A0A1Y5S495_9RHOB|nr:photosynthetic complex assembly protein PuhC [Roseisalinus antarcticus]SLN32269.1 hypothetical protein ROA7023_01116 [Roseisalinus antarcticus]
MYDVKELNSLRNEMKHQDREMVPRALVFAMFGLMCCALALVTFEQLSGRPNVGVLIEAPIVTARTVTLDGDRTGNFAVLAEDGSVLARSGDEKAGFIGVIGKIMDRRRVVHEVSGNPPIQIVRRENGHVALLDPSTDFVVELIGYGADNVAAFENLLN